jgi:hypothetical protein
VADARRPERIHSAYLFPAIVLLLVTQPVLGSLSSTASGLLAIPLTVTLVAGIWSLDRGTLWFRAALGLGLFALGAMALRERVPGVVLPGMAVLAALGVIAVVLGVRWLFASVQITVESLLAALSVYLLMGITFGLVHAFFFLHDPSAYRGVSPAGRSAEIAELMYFSLTTLTTTGYGDIVPAHPVTRLLCNVEAVVGQMYIAVLVAMLVSSYAAGRTGPGAR